MKSLTGIRGIFAVYVFIFHLVPHTFKFIANGDVSVDVFLLLSGFILSFVYSDARGGVYFSSKCMDEKNIIKFLKRRLFRVYPIHIFSILLVISYLILSKSHMHLSIFRLFYNIFLVQILLPHGWFELGSGISNDINYVSWSLSAEVLSYVFFPFILYYIDKFREIKIPLFVISLMVFQFIYVEYGLPIRGYVAFFRCFCDFLLGVLLFKIDCFFMEGRKKKIIVDLLFLLAVFLLCFKSTIPLVLVIFALIIKNIHGSKSFFEKFLSMKIVLYMGEISFSFYMLHFVVGGIMRNVFSNLLFKNFPYHEVLNYLFFTIIFSIFSYHFIENTCRRYLRRRFE